MSFLNSVLSSLNDSGTAISIPQYKPAKAATADSERSSTPVTGKRKAEDQLGRAREKSAKTDGDSIRGATGISIRPQIRTSASGSGLLSNNRDQKGSSLSSKVAEKKERAIPISAASKSTPKKGSFAEILARAKQNQAIPVGTITHKPKETLSTKKELALQKGLALKTKKTHTSKVLNGTPGNKSGISAIAKSRDIIRPEFRQLKQSSNQPLIKSKSPATHQGTTKPKTKPQVTYQGTMKASTRTTSESVRRRGYESEPDRIRPKAIAKPRHERYSEAESGSEDKEDGYEYASEDYSDMDAGFDDVEAEDEAAARAAKKEDAYEQMMLEELKRQKEQRKKRELIGKEKERSMRR